MHKRSFLLIFLCGLVTAPVGAARADLIVNGSFESASIDPGGFFLNLLPGSIVITGWTVGAGDSIDYYGNGSAWNASDGIRSLDLNGLDPGSIFQTFVTAVGQTYEVLFDMAGNTGYSSPDPPAIMELEVSAAGTSGTFSFDTAVRSYSDIGWETMRFMFTATHEETTLNFTSLSTSTGSAGPLLDNVRVAAVPEPNSLSMLVVGAIGVLGYARRLKASASFARRVRLT